MSRKINVLIVEDSAFYRQQISSMLRQSPNIEVIGMVNDGTEAITFISKTLPDVIALDLEMPRMDGFTFLRWLMANKPIPVLVISSLSESTNIFKALGSFAMSRKTKRWKALQGFAKSTSRSLTPQTAPDLARACSRWVGT